MICSRVVNWAVAVASVIRMYQHRVSPEPGTLRAVLPIEKAFPNRLCGVLRTLTPTEICQARLAGAKLVKVFPVGPVGGVEYIRALGGPMGGVPLWVSGGVEIGQIRAFVDLGVKVVGLTDALFSASAMANRDMDAIRAQAARAAQEVQAAAGTPDAART